MQGKRFLEIPMEGEGANLFIEIEPDSSAGALEALGAKPKPSGDFINRYSVEEQSKIVEGSSDLFSLVGKSISHIGKEIYNNLQELSPDTATIKFGVKINSQVGGILLVKAGVDADFSVQLSWKKRET